MYDATGMRTRYPNIPILDTSSRRTYKRCSRLSFLTNPAPYGKGYRKKPTSPPLLFGTLIHEALDCGYQQKPINYTSMLDYFRSHARAEIDTIQREYKPWPNEMLKYEELCELGAGMLEEYIRWAPDVDDFEVVDTEVGGYIPIFSVPKPNETYVPETAGLYYVRFDGLVRDNRGQLWVLEHKTCEKWWNEEMLLLDEQVTAYTWAAEYWYKEPVAGVLMNFLRKEVVKDPDILKNGRPTTSMSRLGCVTADRYSEAIGTHATLNESIVLHELIEREKEDGHPTLRREKLTRNLYAVQAQGERIARELQEMLVHVDHPVSPTPSFLCHSCPMKLVCTQMEEGADWEQTLKFLYEQHEPIWNEVYEDEYEY